MNEFIAKLSSEFKVGSGSESVTSSKVKSFLDDVKRILQKPKEEGQSAYIRESSVNIEPHQVIMSKNSRLVKLIREQQAKEIKELEKDPEANAEKLDVLKKEYAEWKGLYSA